MNAASRGAPPSLGVIGAGTMGSGIALVGLRAGMRVVLVEPVDTMRDRAREYLHRHLEKNGSPAKMRELVLAADLESLSGAQVVIEAVPEDL
ncbi:MAG: 3-hydroxyacyl-CoA dehydrogenase NAD-binding domain-containing protein, partial [Anaerolineales bacterium]